MKRNKFYFWGLLLLIVMVGIVGCRKKETNEKNLMTYSGEVYKENGLPKDQEVTIKTIFPVSGYGKQFFEQAINSFEKKFPNVKVDVRWVEEGNNLYKSMMQTLLQSGNEKDMYTLFPSFGAEAMKELALSGKFEQQDDLLTRNLYDNPETSVEDIILVERKETIIGNYTYSIPHNMILFGLYYNKKMFEKNGWNDVIKDWDEFISLSRKIKASGVSPMVMAGKYPYYFTFGWGAVPYIVGGDDFRDAEYNFRPDVYKSKAYKDMLMKMEYYTKQGFFHPGTLSFDHTQSQMEFLQEKAAMITNATWIANEMEGVTQKGFEWGFMPFPGNDHPTQTKVILTQDPSGYYIWNNKPEIEKKWAKEFILWMFNLDIQKIIAENGGVPVRKDFVLDQQNLENACPSVVVALEKLNSKEEIKIVNKDFRTKTISNIEMAKLPKAIQDGYVDIVSGKKSASIVAEEINRQYMKGIE